MYGSYYFNDWCDYERACEREQWEREKDEYLADEIFEHSREND